MCSFKNMSVRLKRLKRLGKIIIVCIVVILSVMLASLFAAPWRDIQPQPIEYSIDPNIQGIERELLVDAAKQATIMWSDLNPKLTFTLIDSPDVLQIKKGIPVHAEIISMLGGIADGYVECPIWDTDATACVLYVHPYLLHANTVDLQPERRTCVVAHELGHVLGLSHYPDTKENHLMGTVDGNPAFQSTDTKGYVVPHPIP